MAANPGIRIIAAIIGATAGFWVVSHGLHHSTQELLETAAADINKTLPMMVDSMTRLDKVEAGPDGSKMLIYNYTLPDMTKSNMDVPALEKTLRPQVIESYKTRVEMRSLRDANVQLDYRYKDKNGDVVVELDISPKDF